MPTLQDYRNYPTLCVKLAQATTDPVEQAVQSRSPRSSDALLIGKPNCVAAKK